MVRMADLTTRYLGLELRNPFVVGASSLTLDARAVKRCEDAGAGAVVLKSLFEEQIKLDVQGLDQSLQSTERWHSEVFEYMEADIGMRYGTRDYLRVIQECREAASIPVIASINCVTSEWWQDFAAQVQAAGAQALELNVAIMPTEFAVTGAQVEDQYVDIVKTAREAVSIPIAIKLPSTCSSLPNLLLRLRRAGASGFVLFNRFYRPNIDIEDLKLTSGDQWSTSAELSTTLRWISILAGRIDADLVATRGIHTGEDMARALLAGANAVQVASAIYRNGIDHIGVMLDQFSQWMDRKGFSTLPDVIGRMSQKKNRDTDLFGRFQYIKGLVGIQ
jgi:dihydroorotate dehydrogenase (fumarate)